MSTPNLMAARTALKLIWGNAPHEPKLGIDGSKATLTHPFGLSISFDLTRADFDSPEALAARLSGPVAEIRNLVAARKKTP